MFSFRSDPFLWIHIAGIAALPIFLELCLVGLAIGDPIMPVWLELLLIAMIGIGPILWMQWVRPFDIFSILVVAIKPEQLTSDQRQILSRFKTPGNRVVAVVVAIALLLVLGLLYQIYPLVKFALLELPQSRWLGLALASLAFLASNLFVQIPVSVLRVVLTNEAEFASTEPYSLERIPKDFTILGFRINQIFSNSENRASQNLAGAATDSLTNQEK